MVLWSRSILGRQRVPWKVPARFRQQARFHQGSSSVSASPAQIRLGLPTASVLKGSMEFAEIVGQILFGVPKGSVEGSPITSLNLSPSSTTLFIPGWCTQEGLGPKKKNRGTQGRQKNNYIVPNPYLQNKTLDPTLRCGNKNSDHAGPNPFVQNEMKFIF